jgi:hypothetical protein
MPRLIAAVPLPTMRASRPGECAGRAWRDYSGRAAVRRSKRCDLVTPKAKRKVARVARPTADHVERARRRTNDTLLNTLGLFGFSAKWHLSYSVPVAAKADTRRMELHESPRDGGPCPSFRHSSQAERETPHPPPNVRAFITACREGDFPGPLVRRQRAPDAATELESVATFTTDFQQFSFLIAVNCLP